MANEVTASKKPNDTVFIYPASGGGHSCSVHYSDLKYLDYNFMLNDTIIDFYLKYIYHELIPGIRLIKLIFFYIINKYNLEGTKFLCSTHFFTVD